MAPAMTRLLGLLPLSVFAIEATSEGPALGAEGSARSGSADVPWYNGINSIKVFSPGDDVAGTAWAIYNEMKDAQFSTERYAILLRSGNYGDLEMPVGYYTSIVGVGATRHDVTVASFYSVDGAVGGATQNFWRSVEGLTATNPSILWATSQACPVRRTLVTGELWLSESGPPHWSSGGFLGDVIVNGRTYVGTQQQFFFRNTQHDQGVAYETGAWNFVFVGVNGGPTAETTGKIGEVSYEPTTPVVAEKPFLVESNGLWHILVPPVRANSRGIANDLDGDQIPMSEVFVATPTMTSAQINSGIQGKRALLLTPGVYGMQDTIRVNQDNFVVLGLGFPTLVAPTGLSIFEINGAGVRVAHVLMEAGAMSGTGTTLPLLWWRGAGGVGSDVFSRTGSFAYSTWFHNSCELTKTSIHVQLDGAGTVLDNTWLWHADHDDCGTRSDSCYSGNGLVVWGHDITIYDLKVEHMMADMVSWHGENGRVYFYQSELPYHDLNFGKQGYVGYKVDYNVRSHYAVGLGVYIVGDLRVPTAYRVPAWVTMKNMLIWCITGPVGQFSSMVCTSDGNTHCLQGNQCFSNACYLTTLPPGPTPPPPTTSAPTGGWTYHGGLNCYTGHGGSPLPGSADPVATLDHLADCQARCLQAGSACQGIIMPANQDPTQCFLRTSLAVASCESNAAYNLWSRVGAAALAVQSSANNTSSMPQLAVVI